MAKASILFFILHSSFFILNSEAQTIPAGTHKSGPPKKKFTPPVDQLDEFIDRFNDQDPMFAEAFPDRPKRPEAAERAFLVKTLFNPRAGTEVSVLNGFIRQVCNPAAPQRVALADKDCYAVLHCKMSLDGVPVASTLTLKFEHDTNGAEAWRIFSASAPWLATETPTMLPPDTSAGRIRGGLNPAAHGNGFIALHRAFLGPDNFPSNLSDSAGRDARVLASLVKFKRLRLERVTNIVFHFLQVDGYLFTVTDIDAPEGEPSGYLIHRLIRADAEAKRKYRKTVLHVEG